MNDTNTIPRNIPRSMGAAMAGFIAVFILSLATDQLMHALDIYPPWGQPMTATGPLVLALAYRIVYGIAGGYIVARLAPRNPMRHAHVMGGIGLVLSVAGGIAMWDMGAHWYPILLALSAIPCAWYGATLLGNDNVVQREPDFSQTQYRRRRINHEDQHHQASPGAQNHTR